MTINKIDSVKIIHDELCGEEYLVLSGFLRLVGIFVCNATYQDNRLDDNNFDIVVYIENEKSSEENLQKNKRILGEKLCVIKRDNYSSDNSKLDYREWVMEEVFQFIERNDYYLMKDDIGDWRELSQNYLKNDFIKAKTFVNFTDDPKYPIAAKKTFLNILSKVAEIHDKGQKSGRQSRYLNYAAFYLAYLVDESCNYLKQNFIFDSKKLYKAMNYSAIDYDEFENYYLLMAFLAELDPILNFKAEHCYQMAAFKLKNFSYAHYAYYRYGRYCEISLKDKRKARDYYLKAYEANPKEYRAIYKLGYYELMDKRYDAAANYFRMILKLMDGKHKANAFQEKEYEYYYKSCIILQSIGNAIGDQQMAKEYARKAEEVIDNITKISNPIYNSLFGEEARERLSETEKRLKGKGIRTSLLKVQSILYA